MHIFPYFVICRNCFFKSEPICFDCICIHSSFLIHEFFWMINFIVRKSQLFKDIMSFSKISVNLRFFFALDLIIGIKISLLYFITAWYRLFVHLFFQAFQITNAIYLSSRVIFSFINFSFIYFDVNPSSPRYCVLF